MYKKKKRWHNKKILILDEMGELTVDKKPELLI